MANENLAEKNLALEVQALGETPVGRLYFGDRCTILGVDLAWGERNPDGLCVLRWESGAVRMEFSGLTHGDAALLDWVGKEAGAGSVLVAMDAPIVLPNSTGMRPVDRLTHRYFAHQKCGCYPANQALCPRPGRIGQALRAAGFDLGWQSPRSAAEVYPHPALVRWLGLKERIPYKKGPLTQRREHFAFLQAQLRQWASHEIPQLGQSPHFQELLAQPWSKPVEDRTDALVCALIGYWHVVHCGRRSQILGTREEGFLLLPRG